ncbi:hypothetical protein K440DRAFT_599764 [Wilcoxina mikolae CBS 423.85]|nr:hypothetical protein K440DRAFT_599764 [Wilcoxina mikolae CBS 423.85]
MAPLSSSTTEKSMSTALTFGIPLLILVLTQNAVAKIWAVLYLVSIWSASYLLNAAVSIEWLLVLSIFIVSTVILLVVLLYASPLQKLLLAPMLQWADRCSMNIGISEKHTYGKMGDEAEFDIVAVNGLGAHGEYTWRAEKKMPDTAFMPGSKEYVLWLRDLLPNAFPNARIMSFQNDSSYLVNGTVKTIQDCGEQLLHELERFRRSEKERNRPLIFVGHSFGGIIIKQALVQADRKNRAHPVLKSTSGIIFLGTPHDGSWPSSIAKLAVNCTFWMGSSSSIMDALGYQSTELRELDKDFTRIYRKSITCFYETRKTYMLNRLVPILLVDSRSASISGHTSLPIDTDHSGLNKYSSVDDHGYRLIVDEIKCMVDNFSEQGEIHDCLESLKPVDCETLLSQVSKPAVDTCDWIKEHVDSFLRNDSPALVLTGGPGLGKSVLARFIHDLLQPNAAAQTSYFIFKDQNKEETTAKAAIATLVYQLLEKNRKLYSCIKASFDDRTKKKKEWTLPLLWDAFDKIMLSGQCTKSIILIDALDECEDSSRMDLMKYLASRDRKYAGRFIVTSRPSDALPSAFPGATFIDLNTRKEVKNAVDTLIDIEVNKLFKLRPQFDKIVQDKVRNYLRLNAGNMFLWVVLVMERLNSLSSSSPKRLERELEGLPNRLIGIYEVLFKRRLTEDRDSVVQKLPWILYARRAMKLEELREAFGVQDYQKFGGEEWERCLSTDIEGDLNRNFGPLVVIDRESTEVRLVHQSLRDVLLQKEASSEILTTLCRSQEEEHGEIAAACLAYLSLPQFNVEISEYGPHPSFDRLPPVIRELSHKHPFLLYASHNWPYHATLAGDTYRSIIYERFRKLDEAGGNLNFVFQIWVRWTGFNIDKTSALGIASRIGLGWLGVELVRGGVDVHVISDSLRSPLHDAAAGGDVGLVKLLVERGVAIDIRDVYGQTALHHAAQRGQVEMVDLLLKQALPINERGLYGFTPLNHAVRTGHVKATQMLLEAGADPTIADDRGKTPLDNVRFYGPDNSSDLRTILKEALRQKGATFTIRDDSESESTKVIPNLLQVGRNL